MPKAKSAAERGRTWWGEENVEGGAKRSRGCNKKGGGVREARERC